MYRGNPGSTKSKSTDEQVASSLRGKPVITRFICDSSLRIRVIDGYEAGDQREFGVRADFSHVNHRW
jgi:hypothetical protein